MKKKYPIFISSLLVILGFLAGCANDNNPPSENYGTCGENHTYAKYANLIKNLLEENFYVNDTYTCSYKFMSPRSNQNTTTSGESLNFYYHCLPDEDYKSSSSEKKKSRLVDYYATISTADLTEPTMTIRVEAYSPVKSYSKTYVGNAIPQPSTTDIATPEPSLKK